MDQISVGLIGCGVMGTSLATECVRLEHVNVVAVSDVDQALAKQTGDHLQADGYTDYQDLLGRDDVDAVMIAVPGFLHPDTCVAASDAGKHVFCEKPMAVTLSGCDAILEACAQNDTRLMIGHVCRYHGVHGRVKQMVDEGKIGDPTCMVVRRLGGEWSGIWDKNWRKLRAMSGGTLMEVNAHEIDFLRWVCGDVKRVTARGGIYRETQADFEDIMLVTLEFENGAIGLLHSSRASALGDYGGRVDGADGSINFSQMWGENAGIHCARFDDKESEFTPVSDLVVEEPVRAELRAFIDAIRTDTIPPITGHDGRAAVEIALAAYLSARTGEAVTLPLESNE